MGVKTDLAHYQNTALFALEHFSLLGFDEVRLSDFARAIGLSVYRAKALLLALVDGGFLSSRRVRKAGRVWVVVVSNFGSKGKVNEDLALAHLTMLRGGRK